MKDQREQKLNKEGHYFPPNWEVNESDLLDFFFQKKEEKINLLWILFWWKDSITFDIPFHKVLTM